MAEKTSFMQREEDTGERRSFQVENVDVEKVVVVEDEHGRFDRLALGPVRMTVGVEGKAQVPKFTNPLRELVAQAETDLLELERRKKELAETKRDFEKQQKSFAEKRARSRSWWDTRRTRQNQLLAFLGGVWLAAMVAFAVRQTDASSPVPKSLFRRSSGEQLLREEDHAEVGSRAWWDHQRERLNRYD